MENEHKLSENSSNKMNLNGGDTDKSNKNLPNIVKSENDKREYRFLELENKLRVILVSDPKTEKSAASVDVHVGFTTDPFDVSGIAHFCEHMLFLGTTKYPVENDYSEFISKNGGMANAYTSFEHTNYHFDVKADQLEGALDRFAQFFISPLFNADATERELNAINSEHQKNVLNDAWRLHYLDQETSLPGHVHTKFGTGNLDTLTTVPQQNNVNIRQLLLDFHHRCYSSNIMALSVLGKESLDELESMIVSKFSDVPNKNTTVEEYKQHPYGEEQLGVRFNVVTIKEKRSLKMSFPLPDLSDHYKAKPEHYVTHLIGHEGKGSLFSLLKNKAWVNSLCAGSNVGARGYAFLNITMEFTEEGISHVEETIEIVFQYINLIKQQPPLEWAFNEMKMLQRIAFQFKDKESPVNYISFLTRNMQHYPAIDTLYGPYILEEFRADLITQVMQCLRPDNFRYFVSTQLHKGKTDRVGKYYGTEYSVQKISTKQIQQWENCGLHEELNLPKINSFIPECLDVKTAEKKEKAVPHLIKDDEKIRVWYKADDTFLLPKAIIKILIKSPTASTSPLEDNLLGIYLGLVNDELTEFTYDAELAQLNYSVQQSDFGIRVQISGYSDKQLTLLSKVFDQITSLVVKEERFNIIKESKEKNLRNYELNQPYQQIRSSSKYLLEDQVWSVDERLAYMNEVTMEAVMSYMQRFLKNIYVECFYFGNLTTEDTALITKTIEEKLVMEKVKPILPIQHIKPKTYQLRRGVKYLFEKRSKVHETSCIHIYCQVGLQDTRSNVLCELFSLMFREPAFNQLRTKDQLGYIVFSSVGRSSSTQGVQLLVQSEKSPTHIYERINSFITNFQTELEEMEDVQFNEYIDSLVEKKLEKPKRMSQECSVYSSEIVSKQYHFHRAKVESEALKSVTRDDIIQFYKTFIHPSSELGRILTVVVLGKDAESLLENPQQEWRVIDDVLSYKSSLGLYPLCMPYNNEFKLAAVKHISKL